MSESIARKVQPFTIGTKLSAPAVPKSPDFTPQSYHLHPLHHQHHLHHHRNSKSLDNRTLPCNLNDNASLYLSRSQVSQAPHGPRTVSVLPPTVKQTQTRAVAVAAQHQPAVVDMAEEDQLNQNVLVASTTTTTTATATSTTTAVSRSIKKITISGSRENSLETLAASRLAQGSGKASPGQNTNNNNNNNKITATAKPDSQLPAIVGVSCENKPSSHFKVLLRKDRIAEAQTVREQTTLQVKSESAAQQVTSVPRPRSPRSEFKRRESQQQHLDLHNNGPSPVASHSDCFTQRNTLFNQEVLQAEAWIKRKLQDLKGGRAGQCCPLQGSEEASHTLHRDLKDFENTLTQLNQTGEQLICKLNPTAELVRKQLSQLRVDWQTLRQTAANRARAPGGLRSLQEFNRKVEQLEAWIKDKEAEQTLANILAENMDKMQLTRRILDLKQDELLHRTLHQEINQLASKLEKQGKTDSRPISSTRKNINKMWLKVQAHLKTYHENLQLALEASSLYHQADTILTAIHNVRKSSRERGEPEAYGDREIRDIAGQIMMLNVNVSQLSNLHPALAPGVSQKQSEVKDFWAALQRALRSDRSAPPPSASTFTREEDDPLTPGREPHRVLGTEPKRIMGKEVKEEQIRLKGCVTTSDSRSSKRPPSSPGTEPRSASHAPSAPGDTPARQDDVMLRRRSAGERKARAGEQELPPALRGPPQLHVQLQKFTVSADKTLSWLKENVGLATQVCSVVSQDGLEAARRCQEALEKEILSNGTRIEVVKREGRGLIRAQHPGSEKIETFLGQLEFLWEELRRRHQRNAGFLQASEELGFRALKALRGLSGLEAWLESVELSMSHEASVAGDPDSMSAAERESRLLEREVSARGLELAALRQEVERLGEGRGHDHDHGHDQDHDRDHAHGGLPGRLAAVERKFQRVQSALTQQSSELQDTRMLTEFLERVELEESQDLSGSQYSQAQPLHGDITSEPSPLALPGGGLSEPLIESLGDPVGELREAVEMLNDTVRERGRAQSHDQAVRSLLSKHARLAVRVEEGLCCSKELNMDVLERETDMAVRCEPERCGLEELEEQQDQLEIDCEVIREEVEDMRSEASRLEQLCPERLQILGSKVQTTLQAWKELGSSIMENRARLQEFIQLKYFFRSYLAMISWTEDTRSCIFSDTALNLGRDGQEPVATELDRQIEQKFQEFDELASTGMNLLHREHHLTEMVKERMEELRSMLGWISVHWRAQKQQWLDRMKREEGSQDNIYCEAAMGSPLTESSTPKQEVYQCLQPLRVSPREDNQTPRPDSQTLSPASRPAQRQDQDQDQEDNYEVMNRVGRRGGETAKPTVVVLKEPGAAGLGGTVNLLLSLRNTGDSQVQVLEPPAGVEEELKEETSEPVHRVSTYLHVKDSGIALTPVYESITLPRLKTYASSQVATPSSSTSSSSSPSSSSSSSTSSSSPPATQAPGVFFHPAARGGSSMFSSLKRMGKKRKRKRDARRHTIQRIMGVEERAEAEPRYACEGIAYDTHTWPLKEGRRKKQSAVKSPVSVGGTGGDRGGGGDQDMAYMKNPLLMDIDSECSGEYSITPYAVCGGPQLRSHCRFLSLGSVLSFELPKDMSVIPSIQDIITIAPPECKKAAGADPEQKRPTSLSSFKHTPPATHGPRVLAGGAGYPEAQTVVVKDMSDVGETPPRPRPPHHPPPFPGEVGDQTVPCNDLRKASGGAGLQEDTEQEWDKMSLEISSSADYVIMGDRGPRVNPVPVAAPSATHGRHECLSVHTLIQDLDKHPYHRGARLQSEEKQQVQSQASHMVVNLKAAVGVGSLNDSLDSGVSSSGSAKLCADSSCPDIPQPRAVVRRLVSLELEGLDCKLTRVTSQASVDPPPRLPLGPNEAEAEGEPFHTDHQQFEEEEEELEDIWNNTRSFRQSICSDIMYQPHQEEEAQAASCQRGKPPSDTPLSPAKPQAVLYRKLVTASAPNLLVAEFKLPPSIQSLLGYDRDKPAGEELPPVAKGERRSWAAFLSGGPGCESSSVVNERSSDLVKGPDVEDSQRYVYRYGDEEEEVEEDAEEAKVGEEEEQVKEDTACLQDQSVSFLSVLRSPEGASRIGKTSESFSEMENQDPRMATGGRCRTMSGKAELQSMEGTLERKHKLQLGGKKAASRGWNSYHAVLYRHSLCFYQDRKDTLRSSVCGLPLNLVGAACETVPEYTKKPNCLCLRLRDGSEYFLNASSRFMMRKWMLKIQANTGPTNSAPSVSPVPVNQDLPVSSSCSLCPGCQGTDRCHCSSRPDLISTFPRRKDRSAAQAKEIVVLTREYSPQGCQKRAEEQRTAASPHADHCDDDAVAGLRSLPGGSGGNSPPSSSPRCPGTSEQGWLQNKCRSHSFTSATYQKIRPVMKLPAVGRGGELGSSYSVTLVIGDRSGDQGPPASGGPDPPVLLGTAGWTRRAPTSEDSGPWSYASLPRPTRNKSVFKKIFGKKEGHV